MAHTRNIATDPAEPPQRVTDRLIDGTAGFASGALFGFLSFTRRARFFHPTGRAFEATVDLAGIDSFTGSVLAKPGRYPAIVRFSRGAGTPEPQPDGLGFALRLLNVDSVGGHQDFLFVSSVPAPIRRKFIHRYRSYSEAFYSSILPFRAGSRTVLFGVLPLWDGDLMPTARLEELERAIASGRLRFELLAGGAAKPWETIGTVKVGRVLPAEDSESLRFSPFNRAGGIVPIGPANALRRRAYANSQRRRPTPMDDPTTGAKPKYPTA